MALFYLLFTIPYSHTQHFNPDDVTPRLSSQFAFPSNHNSNAAYSTLTFLLSAPTSRAVTFTGSSHRAASAWLITRAVLFCLPRGPHFFVPLPYLRDSPWLCPPSSTPFTSSLDSILGPCSLTWKWHPLFHHENKVLDTKFLVFFPLTPVAYHSCSVI